ncbi:MAG: TolC family protein [Arenimonas sp.]
MKPLSTCSAMALSIFLVGCAAAPVRDDTRVQHAIADASAGAPRLPTNGESYLDDAWFSQELTPERAVQAALLNNPQVRAELSRLDAAQAERIQAGLLRNPMGSLMALRPEGGGRFELDYSLMQSLFDLFTRSRRTKVADIAQERVQAEVMMQLVLITQNTEAAYYEALTVNGNLRLQQERLELEQTSLNLQTRQARQGVVSSTAVLSQQAAVSTQAHALRASEAEQVQALSALAQLLGLSSTKLLLLPDHFPALEITDFNEPQLQALALKHRPDLAAANASIDQARAEKKLQTGALRATEPSIGPIGMRESGGMTLNGLGAQITLPVFDTGRARGALADAQIAQAQFRAEATRRAIPLDVERALATLIANTNALEHAEHHVRQQLQLETLVTRNYQQGNGDYMQLVDAKRLRLFAQSEELQAQRMIRTALVELERATGVAIQDGQFRSP